ncbi:MAG: hypothetical protein HOP16_06665 [Acidobacteria bacterium]|nr:hypothetical protein [Acidobacteriota bacterium]
MTARPILSVAIVVFMTMVILRAQTPGDATPTDALTRLNERLNRGDATLEYRDGVGYLPSLLEHLDINIDSQTLVFSKTSFQHAIINPKNPRALYFNDEVAVGNVPGGDVYELLALEPSHGMVFYSLNARKVDRPRLQRRGIECTFCHGMGNRGALSLVVASVYPDPDGTPAYTSTFIGTIDHRTPIAQRWGGWYVTGTHGSQTHLGNAVALDPFRPLDLDPSGSQNLTTLSGKFDVSRYLAPSSDIVALMTLEHQVGAVNRMNAVAFRYNQLRQDGMSDADWAQIAGDIDELAGYLLFVDEARLVEPVAGTSTFTATFAQRGPRDAKGRSLRDFDLRTRLFRYPLSYMIYGTLFDGLQPPLRDRTYRRLYDVLSGAETGAGYAGLSAADRRAALEILIDTKPGLPSYWTTG